MAFFYISTSVPLWLELLYDRGNNTNPGGNPMKEEALKKMAIEQYLQDKDPVSIYREMG